MREEKTISRLQKVLDFYDRQLDLLKLQLAAQVSIAQQYKNEIVQLNESIIHSQNQFTQQTASSLAHRQMSYQFEAHTIKVIAEKQIQLADANQELDRRKAALRKQLSKIESMEKLIERKTVAVNYERNKREQILADERYLNSKNPVE